MRSLTQTNEPSFSHVGAPLSFTQALVVSRNSVRGSLAVERRRVEVEPGLLAVLHLVDDPRLPSAVQLTLTTRCCAGRVAIEIDPGRGAAGHADDAEPHAGLGSPGFG